jgi:hypothetical protein
MRCENNNTITTKGREGSAVSILTSVQHPTGVREFCLLRNVQTGCGYQQASYSEGTPERRGNLTTGHHLSVVANYQ